MRQNVSLISLLFVVVGCGDDGGGAGNRSIDAAPDDAAVELDASPDAGPVACAEEPVRVTIGAEGGEVALCGARLVVRPGVIAEPTEITIAPGPTPPTPDAPLALAGASFSVSADRAIPDFVEIELPHGGHQANRPEVATFEGNDMLLVEACGADADTIVAGVAALGNFVALYDTYAYRAEVDQNGTGTVSATIGARDVSWTVPGGAYAIDQVFAADPIGLMVVSDLVEGEDGFESLQLQIAVEGQQATLAHAQWFADSTLWTLGEPGSPGTTGVVTIDSRDGDHLIGTATGTLFNEQQTMTFTISFDLTPEFYRFPPERVCLPPL